MIQACCNAVILCYATFYCTLPQAYLCYKVGGESRCGLGKGYSDAYGPFEYKDYYGYLQRGFK